MKIVHVIPFYAPAWSYGGPVRVCYDLANALSDKGYNITILTTDAYDHTRRIGKDCEDTGSVKVKRFRNLSNRLAKKYNLFLPLGLSKYCKKNIKYADVIHLHSFYTVLNIIGAKYAKKYNIPYILHFHESIRPTQERGKQILKRIFIKIWGKKILKNAKSIVVLSSGELEELNRFDSHLTVKATIIPNPGPVWVGTDPKKNLIRKKYNYLKNDKILLSLSRLSRLKGIDLLIKTFGEIQKIDSSFKLIIAGPSEPSVREELEILALKTNKDKINFFGMADQNAKNDLYSIADFYCLFSRYEPFGITILEALSHSLPVFLNKTVGIADDISRNDCVIVVDGANSKSSGQMIVQQFNKKQKMARDCKDVLEKYSLEKIIDKMIKLYKGVV